MPGSAAGSGQVIYNSTTINDFPQKQFQDTSMKATPSEFEKINRKLNRFLVLIGIFVLIAPVIRSLIFSLISSGSPGLLSPANALWDLGRPFGTDFDGSPEQRKLVDRARAANGAEAAKIHLHVLNLSGLTLTEDDIQTIASMHQLRELNLRKTNLQDKDLAQLTGLWRLESLDLSDTAVSDAALPILQKLRNLRSLELAGTKVTGLGVQALLSNMPELRARLYGYHSMHSGNCVHATLGKVILVKYGGERIAFKFTEQTKTGDGGAKYAWYWQPEPGAKFQAKTLRTGEGEVFEKYRRYKDEEGHNFVENDGGELYMHIGPAKLQWSKPRTVYYPYSTEDSPPVLFALTPWERMEDINFDDPSLKWYEKTDGNW
jgi:hypothetical protein